MKARLKRIAELTTKGPIITTRKRLTHYEAIGLILYASAEKVHTAAQINRLLEPSGIKSMVPARLNEMHKRELVFKPDPNRPEWRLTANGRKWIEENVLVKGKRGYALKLHALKTSAYHRKRGRVKHGIDSIGNVRVQSRECWRKRRERRY